MKDCDYEETSEDDSGDEEQIDFKTYKLAYEKSENQVYANNNIIISNNPLKDKEVIPIARVWMAFMAHIPHADADEIRQDLARYETKYIMGLEVSSYEHIHFLALMTPQEYHSFSKKNFIVKHGLRGRATKGKPRQYGKEKEIRDIEKYAKYCLKDQNYLTNMSKDEIEEIIKMKIDEVKNTKSKNANSDRLKDELIRYCNKNMGSKPTNSLHSCVSWNHYHRLLKIKIVDFMRITELSIRKSTIDMYFYHVVTYSEDELKLSSADIVDSLYTTQLM